MIAGQLFNHLLYHFTLTYSNWESVMVCFSESFESLSAGLQKSLWEVGAVPEQHRTDSLSAAVKSLKDEDEFTERYQGLIRHYDMRASHNNPGRGHENGDIEQSHHRFKRAVEPEMILRGCRDFENRAAYEAFLDQIVNRRNGRRRENSGRNWHPLRQRRSKPMRSPSGDVRSLGQACTRRAAGAIRSRKAAFVCQRSR